jgi:hypothetical protein
MTRTDRTSHVLSAGRVIGATLGVAAVVGATACGVTSAPAQPGVAALQSTPAVQQASLPVVVSCEPNQRTLVRPVVVNGASLSQVECVSNGATMVAAPALAAPAAPVAVNDTYRAVRVSQPAADDLGDTRIVNTAPTPHAVRTVETRQQDVYREPVRRTRSVKKSAVIIGSSAGVGAGVGAAVGGKKGALVGAVIGGGGAALWDQITRRDR